MSKKDIVAKPIYTETRNYCDWRCDKIIAEPKRSFESQEKLINGECFHCTWNGVIVAVVMRASKNLEHVEDETF